MSMKHALSLSIVAVLLGIGLVSCSYAQNGYGNSCKNPQFGKAEEGFVNCKPQDAFVKLEELAKHNNPKALYMLGTIYNDGGVDFGLPDIKPNGNLAMKYFVLSAKRGYAEAQSTIAWYYWRDYQETRQKEALYWWCRAALQKDYAGMVNIQMQIRATGKTQTISQYCAPILKSPPQDTK